MKNRARVSAGVIGGSGLYELFDPAGSDQITVATPFGSADVTIGDIGGRRVAFLARHGTGHACAPHMIDYRSNIWALASLGVRAIVSSAAVGSLNPDISPDTIVIPDQYIDRTAGRADTFYDQGSVQHLASADPFCPQLRDLAIDALADTAERIRPSGTVVVIQGPRFSTRAESDWFRAAGGDIVNMTMYPEVPLAAELGIGTVNLSFVTDSDSSAQDDDPVSAELVFSRLAAAGGRVVDAIERIVGRIPDDYAPREFIPRAEVHSVLRRAVL